MVDIVDKGTGDDLTAAEFTPFKNETQNAIEDSGIVLSGSSEVQLSKGISNYVGSGNFYTDSVTANAVVLTAQAPMKAPTALKNGLLVRFDAGGTNTAAVTINVAGLGAKDLVSSDGSALYAGQITAGNYIEAKYKLSDTKFYIVANRGEDVRADGTVPFVEPQAGVTPTASAHLATKGYVDGRLPTGIMMPYAASTAPSGWLECDGSAISRTTYSDLFAILSTTWGVGDGSTTFNLPDTRGEFLRGWDNSAGVDTGRAFASNQTDEFKSHGHPFRTSDGEDGDNAGGLLADDGGSRTNRSAYTGTPGDIIGQQIGGSGGTETRPRNIAVMYIIKT